MLKNHKILLFASQPTLFSCLLVVVLFSELLLQRTYACSTILLRQDGLLLLGHNLDESVDFEGFVCVNKRDVYKVGSTWQDLKTYGKNLPGTFSWISKYGSVTWSSLGRDLPDAGVNEAGLAIEEMSLAGHYYPFNVLRPRLFQMQWIQYHLDNFSTVEEVIHSAASVLPDGWSWHFFVADRTGKCATIEYIHHKIVVHTGPNMPVTALCNAPYSEELSRLKQYKGFGGRKKIDIKNRKKHPRFVRAAHMLRDYEPEVHGPAVDYVFSILENLGGSITRRSYVVDMKNGDVYFRTGSRPSIRHFSMHALDFTSDTPVQLLGLNTSDAGDVTNTFGDYTFSENHRIAESWVNHVRQMSPNSAEADLDERGVSLKHIERYARYCELSLSKKDLQTEKNKYGLTSLHWAAYLGDLQAVRTLVDHNTELNTQTKTGTTALMGAAQSGHLEVVRYLVEKGADIDSKDTSGDTALVIALGFGQSEIAQYLIEKEANAGKANSRNLTPLHYAACNGDIKITRLLVEKGADVKASSDWGFSVLMAAAHAGRTEVLEYLIDKGADIHAQDHEGNSPLLISVLLRQAEAAKSLIAAGASVHAMNHEKVTPWKAASDNKDTQMMRLLKEAGAKPRKFLGIF
jgi:choloylglycine hydrolase